MLHSCSATSRLSGAAKAAPVRGARRVATRSMVVKADLNGTVPMNVLEARAWVEGWKFKQQKVTTLEEGIVKAADYLENTKNVRNAKREAAEAALRRTVKVSFQVKKSVKYGCSLKLVGSAPEMGSWTPANSPSMKWGEGDMWGVALDMKAGTYEFKVVTYADSGEAEWEEGDNRVVQVPLADKDGTSISVELKPTASATPKLAGKK